MVRQQSVCSLLQTADWSHIPYFLSQSQSGCGDYHSSSSCSPQLRLSLIGNTGMLVVVVIVVVVAVLVVLMLVLMLVVVDLDNQQKYCFPSFPIWNSRQITWSSSC